MKIIWSWNTCGFAGQSECFLWSTAGEQHNNNNNKRSTATTTRVVEQQQHGSKQQLGTATRQTTTLTIACWLSWRKKQSSAAHRRKAGTGANRAHCWAELDALTRLLAEGLTTAPAASLLLLYLLLFLLPLLLLLQLLLLLFLLLLPLLLLPLVCYCCYWCYSWNVPTLLLYSPAGAVPSPSFARLSSGLLLSLPLCPLPLLLLFLLL